MKTDWFPLAVELTRPLSPEALKKLLGGEPPRPPLSEADVDSFFLSRGESNRPCYLQTADPKAVADELSRLERPRFVPPPHEL